MKLKMFSVYDSMVAAFGTPFYCTAESYAHRAFIDAYESRGSSLDFVLYYLGEFDCSCAVFDPVVPQRIFSMAELKARADLKSAS